MSEDETDTTVDRSLYFDSVQVDDVSGSQMSKPDDKDWFVTMGLQDVKVSLKIDTGAQANVLSYTEFKIIQKQAGSKIKLFSAKAILRSYSGSKLEVRSRCILNVSYRNKCSRALFYVCEGPIHNLLGRDLCERLDLIKLNCSA